jgi:hypothetical protein
MAAAHSLALLVLFTPALALAQAGGDDLNLHAPRSSALFAPLRLSLTSGLFPVAPVLPGCDSRTDASGNSVNGFAVQRYSVLRLVPGLTLHGYSSAGCAVDAGLGGALTYHAALSKDWWLVPSVGMYTLPTPGGATTPLVTSSARVDVMKQLDWGGTLHFGVGLRHRVGQGLTDAVSFGGSF